MEFLPRGDLQRHLDVVSTLPEPDVQKITFQVLEGLSFMHENGFAHRDLKPAVSIRLYLYGGSSRAINPGSCFVR
jgi:calcium/calmodulin-dependent protein kinase I